MIFLGIMAFALIPLDIWRLLCVEYLSVFEFVRLYCCYKILNGKLANDDTLWKHFYCKNISEKRLPSTGDYKAAYMQIYTEMPFDQVDIDPYAAERGYEKLLSGDISLESCSLAVKSGYLDIVKSFDVSKITYLYTPFTTACKYNRKDIFDHLWEKFVTDAGKKMSIFDEVAQEGHLDYVKGKTKTIDPYFKLIQAANTDDLEAADAALAEGTNIGTDIYSHVVRKNALKILSRLLDSFDDDTLNLGYVVGYAIIYGNIAALKIFMEKFNIPAGELPERTPGNIEMYEYLISIGRERKIDKCIVEAAQYGKVEFLDYLLKKDPTVKADELMKQANKIETAEYLLHKIPKISHQLYMNRLLIFNHIDLVRAIAPTAKKQHLETTAKTAEKTGRPKLAAYLRSFM